MNLAQEFAIRDSHKPKPKWIYGDRISGRVGKILVVGMVIREKYEDPKQVLVHLDLPLKIDGDYRCVMYVPARNMKLLKDLS